MSSPLLACRLSSAKMMSCLRERAIFSMPISRAISISSCVDLFFKSVRLIGFALGTLGSRRGRRCLPRRDRPWCTSPSPLLDASLSAEGSPSAGASDISPSLGTLSSASVGLSFNVRPLFLGGSALSASLSLAPASMLGVSNSSALALVCSSTNVFRLTVNVNIA